ncbi:MAG: hypothetical protein ACREHC_00975 [Candidatus Levyibacteriota bacterium]
MNRPILPTATKNPDENIWKNYDPKRVRAALKKSAGILKEIDRKTLLHDLANQRKQKGRNFSF